MRRKPGELRGTGWGLLGLLLCLILYPACFAGPGRSAAGRRSTPESSVQATPAQVNSSTYQGSIVKQAPVPGVLPLPLDQAIRMGLQYNLGLVLSGVNAGMAGAQRLQQLQTLLPTINATFKEAVQQTDLQALGLRRKRQLPGHHRALWIHRSPRIAHAVALLNVSSLQNYLASKHNFASARSFRLKTHGIWSC